MSLADLQERARSARGDTPRRVVIERASALPGAPDWLTEGRLRSLETFLQAPPRSGEELRFLCAALGVPLVDALTDLGYWPPVLGPYCVEAEVDRLLREAAALGRLRLRRQGALRILEPG